MVGFVCCLVLLIQECLTPDELGITAINLSPDPVKAGQNLNVTLSGKAGEAITGGTAVLGVTVFGVKIATLNFDLCTQFNIKCPLAAGEPINAMLTYAIPSEAPSGITATCEIDVTDTAGAKLGCYTLDVQIQ